MLLTNRHPTQKALRMVWQLRQSFEYVFIIHIQRTQVNQIYILNACMQTWGGEGEGEGEAKLKHRRLSALT